MYTKILLGSSITLDALSSSFESKLGCILTLISRLETLFANDAFYLLRRCFAIPKLLYLLCTSPSCRVSGLLEKFDELIHTFFHSQTNFAYKILEKCMLYCECFYNAPCE